MRGKRFWAIALAALLSLGSVARAEQGVTSTSIEIGAFGPITGPAAYIGLGGRDGANLAIKEINAGGGVNGRKLVMHFEDDGHSPTKALAAVKKLIDEEKKTKPFSDNQIAQLLHRESVFITRRTVAKYREQMQIAGSRERKLGYLFSTGSA